MACSSPVGKMADDDARQARLALQPHEEVLVDREVEDQPAGNVRDEVAPVAPAGRGDRRGDDLEVLRPVGIGEDEEAVVAVVEVVLLGRLAPRDQARLAVRPVGVEHAEFRGLVVVGRDRDEAPRLGLADADEEAGMAVLVDDDVGRLLGADDMAIDPRRPVVLVHPDIEEGLAVAGPHRVAGGALDAVGKVLAGLRCRGRGW